MEYHYPINKHGQMIIKIYKSSPNGYYAEGVFITKIFNETIVGLSKEVRIKIEKKAVEFKERVKRSKVVDKIGKKFNGDPIFIIKFIKKNSIFYRVDSDPKPRFMGKISKEEIELFWQGFMEN